MAGAVLAVAKGYSPTEAHRFLGSLRQTGYADAVILLVGDREAPATLEMMRRHTATTRRIPVEEWCCGGDDRVRSKLQLTR
eukprot:6212189-Prymnesium_polylepis.1